MSVWLHYWRPEDVDYFFTLSRFRVDCTGSDQSTFFNKYKKGDIVWFHSILENKQHILLGRIVLETYLPKIEAGEFVGRSFAAKHKFNFYWVAEKPWNKLKDISLGDVPLKLDFMSNKQLPTNYNGQHFQAIRELTEQDHAQIQDLWDIWTE